MKAATRPATAALCVSRGRSEGMSPRATLLTPFENWAWFIPGSMAKGRVCAKCLQALG